MEIYDLESGETAHSYMTPSEKITLAWHPKKHILAVGGEEKKDNDKNDKNDKNEKNEKYEGVIQLVLPK